MNIKYFFNALNKKRFLWPFKIAITLLVIYMVNKSIGTGQVPRLVRLIKVQPLVLSLLLGFVSLSIQTKRWKLLLGNQGIAIGFKTALQTMLWGSLLAFITPGRSGEFFRGISIATNNKTTVIYTVFIEKIYAVATTLFAGALGAFVSWKIIGESSIAGKSILLCALVIMVIIAIILAAQRVIGISMSRTLRSVFPKIIPERPFDNFTSKNAATISLLSILAHITLLLQTAVLLDMFGFHAIVPALSIAAQAYTFMMFFPIFIANMGIREYSFGMFLAQFCVLHQQSAQASGIAFGASMGILCINLILPALAGLVWWMVELRIEN